jgi:hypothetical protein
MRLRAAVTATDAGYHAAIATGSSAASGFQGTWTANGTACT